MNVTNFYCLVANEITLIDETKWILELAFELKILITNRNYNGLQFQCKYGQVT